MEEMEESRGSASSPGMAVVHTIEGLVTSIFGVDSQVVSLGPYHHGEDHAPLSQMEESIGIAPSPATRMADEHEEFVQEALRNPSDELFISILDGQQPDREGRSKHRIQKAPAKFREYGKDKNYFDPQVVSLGPYHRDDKQLKLTNAHKITAAKQFIDGFKNVTGERGAIYKEFKALTGTKLKEWKECYDAEVVADMSEDVFARMMFLDGCFVLHFIENILEGGKTKLEISKNDIPFIIRDMLLIENQLPFEVLDALMNLLWGPDNSGKAKILKFIKWEVLIPMGFWPVNSSRSSNWCRARDSPLHLLDILRTVLLDFPTSRSTKKASYPLYNFRSVMQLKEMGIRFEGRDNMRSLMDISYKENLLFPQLLLPKLFINPTTMSQLLNLTAFEVCSDTYSGCGVTSFIHFMDSLINDNADMKILRSEGILQYHSLGSDDEVACLFNTWPADVTNHLQLFGDISRQLCQRRDKRVKICIATRVDKYFGRPYSDISFVVTWFLLFNTFIQLYFETFPRR